jgi:hypothetical protein
MQSLYPPSQPHSQPPKFHIPTMSGDLCKWCRFSLSSVRNSWFTALSGPKIFLGILFWCPTLVYVCQMEEKLHYQKTKLIFKEELNEPIINNDQFLLENASQCFRFHRNMYQWVPEVSDESISCISGQRFPDCIWCDADSVGNLRKLLQFLKSDLINTYNNVFLSTSSKLFRTWWE